MVERSKVKRVTCFIQRCVSPSAQRSCDAREQGHLRVLFPELGEQLFPGGMHQGGDESDDEAVEALSAALDKLALPP